MEKYTTEALKPNEHLTMENVGFLETWCEGYRDGKPANDLDGYYTNKELNRKAEAGPR